MVFVVFDHDSLVSALQHVWDRIAPPAMFTAAGNVAVRGSENFLDALDLLRWNKKTSDAARDSIGEGDSADWGYSGDTVLKPSRQEGSNGPPTSFDAESGYFVEGWGKGDDINVPPGFSPIRGENILYADTLPPLTLQVA